ncbi:MAG: hypothetical protein H5U02_05590 [Clostridia bacterium]|nr:hypothetical protein [Clostridia bacterium]
MLWGTLQSRLVVELRVQGISDLNQANAFLPGFIERFNARFQVEPEDPEPAYLASPDKEALEAIICAKETRVATGSVLSYQGETYCLTEEEKMLTLPQKARVEILLHLDGSIDAQYNQKRYELSPFKRPPKRQEMAPPKPKGHKPKPDHPWRQYGLPKRQYDPVEDYFRKHERQHINPGGWRPPEVG